MFAELLQAALEMLEACDCTLPTGCPGCVHHMGCGEYNKCLDKHIAISILKARLLVSLSALSFLLFLLCSFFSAFSFSSFLSFCLDLEPDSSVLHGLNRTRVYCMDCGKYNKVCDKHCASIMCKGVVVRYFDLSLGLVAPVMISNRKCSSSRHEVREEKGLLIYVLNLYSR
jgi:hypothetical protein